MRGLGAFWITMGLGFVVACGDDNPASGPDAPQQGGVACADGIDNDGDGTTDFPEDLGCENSADPSEEGDALPQCSDGRDNDGDGKTDFPDDPGCLVAQADSETDDCPDGANCPQCANGIDDDGNGMSDFPEDPGCESAADTNEFTSNPNACGQGLAIEVLPATGIVNGLLDASSISGLMPSCGGFMGTSAKAYVFTLTEPKVLTASTDDAATVVDTVLTLRSANCSDVGAELACNDDASMAVSGSTIAGVQLAVGTYYLIVQGQNMAEQGAFALTVALQVGEGAMCAMASDCGPGLVCRTPMGGSDMICTDPVCSDGIDDDGDGKIDFPLDPGCTSIADDSETDTCPGAGCPACGDGLDNDGDGAIDYPLDPGCRSASGPIETCDTETDGVEVLTTGSVSGTLANATDDLPDTCGNAGGRDRLYTVTVPDLATLTIDTENSVSDTVLVLLPSTCGLPEIECDDDDGTSPSSSKIVRTNVAAGTYVIAVDGYDADDVSAYNLNIAGTVAAGGSCESALFTSGVLTCAAGFTCDGMPGSRTCISQCSDGLDNNMDGTIDFPMDPGCQTAADNTEDTVCPGASCPQCADGLDNNSDGPIDYPADTSCAAASDNREGCETTEPIIEITAAATTSTTVGQTNDVAASCGSSSSVAPDRLFALDVPALASLAVTFTNKPTAFDMAHSVLNSTCAGPALSCRDPDNTTLTNLAAGRYYISVDGYFSDDVGDFTLNVAGVVAPGESCEGVLFASGALTCSSGLACNGMMGARTCAPAACSDGLDNNSAGGIDYPFDPGCESSSDNSEDTVACPGPMCPVCSNTADDDTDLDVDFPADYGCSSASATTEVFCAADVDFGGRITMPTTTATLATAADNFDQSCQMNTGSDLTFSLSLPVPVLELEIDTNGSVANDTVLSFKDASCTAELACDDDGGDGVKSLISLDRVPAGNYAISVDSFSTSNNLGITLNVHGEVAAGTACTSPLFLSGVLECESGTTCTANVCQ